MANYANLKATINANIKANGNEEITGPILNTVLNQAVTTLGAGYQYMGVATPATSPGTPDANVFYIASTAGTYTNFGGAVVADGEVAILKYNGSWTKEVSGAATAAQVTQLGQKVDDISTGKYYGYYASAGDLPTSDSVPGFAYVGTGPTYTIYSFNGTAWTSSGITVNQSPIGNNEDIDQDESGKLQFANRTYNPLQPNGMGYKILRKDATFASQVTATNTIYEIRYAFDLGGASVTIPAGCVLKFDGGMLSNGTLVGQGTRLSGNLKHIFAESITPSGTFDIPFISTNFFATLAGDNALRKVIALSSDDVYNRIEVEDGNYYFSLATEAEAGINIKSKTDIRIDGTLILRANSLSVYELVQILNKSNVNMFGVGILQGDKGTHIGASESGHCIQINTCENVKVDGLTFKDANGDGVAIYGNTNVSVTNVQILNSYRNGLGIVKSSLVTIDSCTIDGVDGTAPEYGIDVEPNADESQYCAIIRNCTISNCAAYGIGGLAPSSAECSLVKIENCRLLDTLGMGYNNISQLNIDNVHSNKNGIYLFNCQNAEISSLHVDDSNVSSSILSSKASLRDCSIKSSQDTYLIINNSTADFRNCEFELKEINSSTTDGNIVTICGCRIKAGMDIVMADGSIVSDCILVFDKGSEHTPSWVVRTRTHSTSVVGGKFVGNKIDIQKSKNYIFNISGKGVFRDNEITIGANCSVTNVFLITSPIVYDGNSIEINSNATVSFTHRFFDAATLEASKILHKVLRCTTATRPQYLAISNRLYNIDMGSVFFDETIGKNILWLGTKWANVDGSPLLATSGATSARPSATTAGAGYTYFDTDLGKMIVSNGTTWVNMDGSALS